MSEIQHIIIRIFSSYCSSTEAKQNIEKWCMSSEIPFYGKDKKIYITDGDDYTHIVILNTAMPNIPPHIPKKNVLGLAYEPLPFLQLTSTFVEYAQKYIGFYLIGDVQINSQYRLPAPFFEQYSFIFL